MAKPRTRHRQSRWKLAVTLLLAGLVAFAGYEYWALPEVGDLAKKNPPTTALMEQRAEEAKAKNRRVVKQQRWVALSEIAKVAVDAVVMSEDAAFYQHHGVDTDELKIALQESWEQGQLGRGASTITMQLAKNLWFSTDRSVLRKLKELLATRRLEEGLTKQRILTLYLNIAEWGDGIYGIEAAARAHFGVSASQLSAGQAVILATMLPAPRKWLPARKSKNHHDRALRLVDKLEAVGRISASAAAEARAEVKRVLGAGGTDEDADEAEP